MAEPAASVLDVRDLKTVFRTRAESRIYASRTSPLLPSSLLQSLSWAGYPVISKNSSSVTTGIFSLPACFIFLDESRSAPATTTVERFVTSFDTSCPD